jgi:hypothetical protein
MSQEPEKKIIVDEDWKTQVERERAEAQKTGEPAVAGADKPSPVVPLPPPSLTYLATTLYFQAMTCLGLMPDPASGKAEKNLPLAKHFIDMLELLQQKTEGNRTPEESDDFESMLYQLRMAYVQSAG